MELEESPFLEPTSDTLTCDAESVSEESGATIRSSYAQYVTKKVKRKSIFAWGSVTVLLLLLLFAFFGVGVLVGNLTANRGTHSSNEGGGSDQISTPNATSTTPTTPSQNSPCNNTPREDICENPPVLLISLDGFWNGYFARNLTPSLSTLAREGVKAEFVRSAYPTKTFPNHYTIVTGLYPESHGIVDNNFYDKTLDDTFYQGNKDPKWWLGDPVWNTAGRQGLKSGTFFWPGSDAPIGGMYPNYYETYDSSVSFEERVLKILEWLDYPSTLRPQFLTMYLNEPDHAGHEAGPDSVQVDAALGRVDAVIEDLIVELKMRGIYDCINIIVVSDHGMVASDPSKRFFLPPYIPEEYVDSVSFPTYGVTMNINIGDGNDMAVEAVYAAIQNISGAPFQAFYLNDLPLRLHVGHHNRQRYGDIYVIGDLGSYVTPKSGSRVPLGEHGYDNNEVSMQSLFLARGPAFKEGYVSPGIDNIQVYNLLCALLNITPSDNNGTFGALHHMLKPDVADMLPPVTEQEGVVGVKADCALPSNFVCQTCLCSRSCQSGDNNELLSTSAEVARYQSMHLPYGVPRGGQGDGACLLTNKHSVTLFSTVLHIPLWVAFSLDNQMRLQPVNGDTECYQADPRISSLQCGDYRTSTDYTLTHLAPTDDLTYLSLISNAVPQFSNYYNIIWSEWEKQLMNWTDVYGTLHVITGCLLDSDGNGHRDPDSDFNHWLDGEGSVAVPSGFYSIVTRCVETTCPVSSLEALGLLLHHRNFTSITNDVAEYLKFRLSTVTDIESATGINFFPNLSPEQQATLKLHIQTALWA